MEMNPDKQTFETKVNKEQTDKQMDMMSKSTDDTLSEAKKLEIGQNAHKEKDAIKKAKEESEKEKGRRNTYIKWGAYGVGGTGALVVGFEIGQLITAGAGAGTIVTGGVVSSICGGAVVAAASILYSKYEIENSIKTKKECAVLMDEFDLEFEQIQKDEKLTNEEQYIVNAFRACLSQNRKSQENLGILQKDLESDFIEYNKRFDYYDKKCQANQKIMNSFVNPNQKSIEENQEMIESGQLPEKVKTFLESQNKQLKEDGEQFHKEQVKALEKDLKTQQTAILIATQQQRARIDLMMREIKDMDKQYELLNECLIQKSKLMKQKREQAGKDADRQYAGAITQVLVGLAAVIGGIVLLCFAPVLAPAGAIALSVGAIALSAGGGISAGAALFTKGAMNESYESKDKYSDKEKRLEKMQQVVQTARKKLETQRRRLEDLTIRLDFQEDQLNKYLAGEIDDDDVFNNPLTAQDLKMVGEIVQEIGSANDEFATNFKKGAK